MIPNKQRTALLHILFELILLTICTIGILLTRNGSEWPSIHGQWIIDVIQLLLIFNFGWLSVILFIRNTTFYTTDHLSKKIKSILLCTFTLLGIISTIAIFFKIEYFNRSSLVFPILLFSTMNIFFLSLFYEWFKRKNTSLFGSKVLLVGVNDKIDSVSQLINKMGYQTHQCVGVLGGIQLKEKIKDVPYMGKVSHLSDVLETVNVDEVFVSTSVLKGGELKKLVKASDYHGVRVKYVPETPFMVGNNFKSYKEDPIQLFQHRVSPLDYLNSYLLKKCFDMFFASLVLILLFPLFLLIGILIRLDSKGPVFYFPLRKGEGGRVFTCFKFRTMKVCDDPVNGTRSTIKGDPRITRVGKYLRKLDLDELPQFLNVLKGDMSVVGPRPHRVNLEKDFRSVVNDYMVRHYVKPGVTGWAQINGWRGPTVTDSQKKNRVLHDIWYIENWTFLLDVKIIFLTVFGRKTRENAF